MSADNLDDRIGDAVAKLEEMIASKEMIIFDREEAMALQEVAEWWIAFRGAGRLGGALFSGVKWMVFIIAAWVALKAGILEWIAHGLGDGK